MIAMTLPQARRCECTLYGRVVRFPPMAARLLELLLMISPHRRVDQEEIIEWLWPDPDLQALNTMKITHIYIGQLRAGGVAIETEWGRGWSIPEHARNAVPMRLAA